MPEIETEVIPVNESEAAPLAADYIPPAKHIDWPVTLFIIGIHIAALAAFWTFSWSALAVCLGLHFITTCLGITLGYHRLLTHRSFKTPKLVEYALTLFACLACQAGPLTWVAGHRLHHLRSDQPEDPHSPRRGFFWAHMGWIFFHNPAVNSPEGKMRFAPDLARDKVHVFLEKTHIRWTFLLAALLYLWGGWPFVVWGIFVRVVIAYHCTWLVNSAAHVWGYKTYATRDDSTNLWWVAALSYGEGWHNNHHAFQSSARHGLKWWEVDLTYGVIKAMQSLRLASDLKIPSEYQLKSK